MELNGTLKLFWTFKLFQVAVGGKLPATNGFKERLSEYDANNPVLAFSCVQH